MVRVLLPVAALFSEAGSALHAMAFLKASKVIAASGMPAFYRNACMGLWLIDSASMMLVAAICLVVAFRPRTTTRLMLMLVALFPVSTAALLYFFEGNFFAAHMELAISILMLVAAAYLPRDDQGARLRIPA